MKYKSTTEFLRMLNKDSQIEPLIKAGFITAMDEKNLIKYNIKPKIDGFYTYSQAFDLSTKIREEIKRDKGEKALLEAFSFIAKDKYYENLKIIKSIIPDSSVIQRFLIATLSDKFENEISDLRHKFDIPRNGFDLKIESERKRYDKWVIKMKTKAKKELEDKSEIDYAIENKLSGYIFGEKDNYSDNIFTTLGKLKFARQKTFEKYKVKVGFIDFTYFLFGFTSPSIIYFLNDLNNSTPFQISTKWTIKDNDDFAKISWVNPQNKFGIFIDRPVTKDALIEYIKKSKQLKESLDEYYASVQLNENFQRDWLTYKYYKLGYSHNDISNVLREYDYKNTNKNLIKITISRMKKRVKDFDKVTQ